MSNELKTLPDVDTVRLEWVEPQVHQLDLAETAFQPGGASDGEARFADCTTS